MCRPIYRFLACHFLVFISFFIHFLLTNVLSSFLPFPRFYNVTISPVSTNTAIRRNRKKALRLPIAAIRKVVLWHAAVCVRQAVTPTGARGQSISSTAAKRNAACSTATHMTDQTQSPLFKAWTLNNLLIGLIMSSEHNSKPRCIISVPIELFVPTNALRQFFFTVYFIITMPQYAFRQLFCHHQGVF
jgi:hypothetical protein